MILIDMIIVSMILKGPCHGQLFFYMFQSFMRRVQGHICYPNPIFGCLRIEENLKILVLVWISKVAIRNNTGISKLAIRNNKGISKLAIRNNIWNSKLAILNKEHYLVKNFHFEIFEISPTLKILWNIVIKLIGSLGCFPIQDSQF